MNAFNKAESLDLLVGNVRAWRPDAHCIAAGDEQAIFAIRSYAAAGLSNRQIGRRMRSFADAAGEPELPAIEHLDAAIALARHGAIVGASARQIIRWLVSLSSMIPCWPDDPDLLADIARGAVDAMRP